MVTASSVPLKGERATPAQNAGVCPSVGYKSITYSADVPFVFLEVCLFWATFAPDSYILTQLVSVRLFQFFIQPDWIVLDLAKHILHGSKRRLLFWLSSMPTSSILSFYVRITACSKTLHFRALWTFCEGLPLFGEYSTSPQANTNTLGCQIISPTHFCGILWFFS